MKKSKQWTACLPIGASLKSAEVPEADLAWLATRGIEGEALSVLRLLRRQVLPLVRKLEKKRGLVGYHFLVHDRTSGVPCPPEDSAAYIQMRLWFKRGVDGEKIFAAPWCYAYAIDEVPAAQIAGDGERAIDGGAEASWWILNEQAAWYLALIESFYADVDDIVVLKHVRQFLHYFANMAQMRIQ